MSVVLFGSGAEGQWRPTSDVNLVGVLRRFEAAAIDRLREPFRLSHAAIALEAMFILVEEVPQAAEAFAVKFADIRRRHRVLHGSDPFADLPISRPAELARCRQVLLNLTLRLRERYVLQSLRDEQAALAVADAAGHLRAAAAALCELEGKPAPSPREALAEVARALPGRPWEPLLAQRSAARRARTGPRRPGRRPRPPDRPAEPGMSDRAQRLEALLARIYVDPEARARFLADPEGEARRAGVEGLGPIDRVALESGHREPRPQARPRRR